MQLDLGLAAYSDAIDELHRAAGTQRVYFDPTMSWST